MIALTIVLAAIVGVLLGLLGGGGSVLAVPLLVYVAGLGANEAAATSLFVVAVTSAIALVTHAREGRVRWRAGLDFGIPGAIGAFLGGQAGKHVPDAVVLTTFAVLMVSTAVAMIRGRRAGAEPDVAARGARWKLARTGFAVGGLTGFVGAGGGFLIVPALVLLSGLSMSFAIGTSLFVLVLQSLSGLAGHLIGAGIDWGLALGVTASAIVGSLIGGRFTGRFAQDDMRRIFGWFVLTMGLLVLGQQLPGAAAGWVTLAVLTVAGVGTLIVLVVRRRNVREPPHGEPALLAASRLGKGADLPEGNPG